MKAGVIFGNLIVSGREDKRLTPERFRRMAESGSVADAVKILYEAGYGEGVILDNPADYDTLISGETVRAIELFDDLSTNDTVTYCFLSEYLYHNAKVYYKARYGGDTSAAYGYASQIKDEILEKRYQTLPAVLENALTYLDEKFSDKPVNPREIDTAIDTAYYEDIFARLKKLNNKSVREYFAAKAELNNFHSLVRAKLLQLPAEIALNMLVPAAFDIEYAKMYGEDISEFPAYYKSTVISDIIEDYAPKLKEDKAALVNFEVVRDNYLLEIIKRDIDNYFKIDGIIYYYVSRIIELKTARMIMVLLNNNIDRAQILARIRAI